MTLYEPHHEKNCFYIYAKTKVQINRIGSTITLLLNPIIKPLAIFCGITAWYVSDLVGNPENRYFHESAPILLVLDPSTPSNAIKILLRSRSTGASVWIPVQRQEENYYRDRPPLPKYRPKSSKGTVLCLPPARVGRHIVFPLASVCLSVCLSVRPPVCLSQKRVHSIT